MQENSDEEILAGAFNTLANTQNQEARTMTPILKVITEYCAVYVDDVREQQRAVSNMPLYARKMWSYLQAAIPFFTIPSAMFEYLVGTYENPKIKSPLYGSLIYTVEEDLTADFILELNDEGKGYELFNCQIQEINDFENTILYPTNLATYDRDNGTVTFHATSEQPIAKGTVFNMDFYTDGYFTENLSGDIMRILGMCFQLVWQMRFNNDWLSIVPKVEDKSFFEQNRANKMKTDDERLNNYQSDLAGAMRRYEQKLVEKKVIPNFFRGLI